MILGEKIPLICSSLVSSNSCFQQAIRCLSVEAKLIFLPSNIKFTPVIKGFWVFFSSLAYPASFKAFLNNLALISTKGTSSGIIVFSSSSINSSGSFNAQVNLVFSSKNSIPEAFSPLGSSLSLKISTLISLLRILVT